MSRRIGSVSSIWTVTALRRLTASILIAFFATATPTFAQLSDNPNRQWSAVSFLQAGVGLQIQLKDGRKAKGNLDETSATGLTLSNKNSTTSIDRAEILKIFLVGGRTPV